MTAIDQSNANQNKYDNQPVKFDADSNSISIGDGELDEPTGACASIQYTITSKQL